jgi:hypothetical protein
VCMGLPDRQVEVVQLHIGQTERHRNNVADDRGQVTGVCDCGKRSNSFLGV